MIQIKYVNTTLQFVDIHTKGSLTRDRWTQLTLLPNIMTHTISSRSHLSVSSVVVSPWFSARCGSFAASASAKQKPVHCTAMTARNLNDKNADEAGGDSKREELCQQDPKTLQ